MRVLGKAAIAAGLFINGMAIIDTAATAGALPAQMSVLQDASPTEVVQAAWSHRSWRRHHRGWLAGGVATGVTLNPHPFRYGYCGYFPCPVYEPPYIPYAYYGAPYYAGYYVACAPGYWDGPYCGY